MSGAKPCGPQQWEYRQLCLVSNDSPSRHMSSDLHSPDFTQWLTETIKLLDQARSEGWRLVAVKVEPEGDDRWRVTASMKRPRGAMSRLSVAQFPVSADQGGMTTCGSVDVKRRSLSRPSIEKAA